MKVYIETYGCSANINNSEIILAKALNAGHTKVETPEEADIIIINTCTVKHLTEQKIFHRISSLSSTFKNKKIIITGCMVPIQSKELLEINPKLELVEWNRLDKFDSIFSNKSKEKYFCMEDAIGIVQINTGCLGSCTFCIVRLIKGRVKSREIKDIVEEVGYKVNNNKKEIWITSTDTAAYGYDISTSLYDLLNHIVKEVKGEYRLRVGMMNPMLLRNRFSNLLNAMDDEHIYKFLHLPIQSASKKVLDHMRRPGSKDEFVEMHDAFRNRFKESSFATDIIVGYPTEKDEDFEETLSFIKNVKPDMTHVSKYGPRKGTEAAKLRKIDSAIVKERSRLMSEEAKKAALYRNKQWYGWKGKVLITKIIDQNGEKVAMGRNDAYKRIYIYGYIPDNALGKFLNVKIKGYTHSHLEGKITD